MVYNNHCITQTSNNLECVCVYIKDPSLLIEKSSPCSGASGFPLSLYKWSFTICPTPYNSITNVLSASLNKMFPSSFLQKPLMEDN